MLEAAATLARERKPSKAKFTRENGITLNTLLSRLRAIPRQSKFKASANRSHLNEEESQALISFVKDSAMQGFAPRRIDLTRFALEIACVRNPALECLGKHWVDRWLTRYSDELGTIWTSNLEMGRASHANPTAIAHYFELLKAQPDHYNFWIGNIYAFDESGFAFGGDQKHTRVVVAKGTHIQHA